MQKKLIALAIAGLASSAAFAQTNVTIYGIADLGYVNATSDVTGAADKEFSGIATGNASGSRLGFRAVEDLGGGWSAGALYEFGTLNPDGGAAGSAASVSGLGSIRQSYIHLTSTSMGSFQGGRIYTPGHNTLIKFDPEGASLFGPASRLTTGMGGSINVGTINNSRLNNSVAWLSPNWKGFTAQAQYSFGESGRATTGSTDDQKFWGLGVDYTNGPLAVAFAYHDFSDYLGTVAAASETELTEWIVGASYDFGMLKLFGSYNDLDADNMATVGGAGVAGAKVEGDMWQMGVTIPVFKAGSVHVSYANLDRDARAAAGAAKVNQDADGWGLSYWHNLSKRTTLYIGYTEVNNDNGSAITVGGVGAPSAGKDSSGYGMGMRHTF